MATKSKARKTKTTDKPRGGWPTREQWLNHAAELVRPLLKDAGADFGKVRVSVGWPKGSRGGKGTHAIGQCWCKSVSGDGTHEIFISPELDDPARVLDVLAHELVHAAVGIKEGHRGEFKRVATAIGLEGKMTATVAGPDFEKFAKRARRTLGRFPHAQLSARQLGGSKGGPEGHPGEGGSDAPPKQTTRLLKVGCPECGRVARITRKWIDAGLPTCACDGSTQWLELT